MNPLKSLAHRLATLLLPLMLFSFGGYVTAYHVLQSPEPVKSAISRSGLYEAVIAQAVDDAQDSTSYFGSARLAADDPAIQEIIKQSAAASVTQSQTEAVIDRVYAWLHGSGNSLHSNLDLQGARTRLADSLAAYTENRLRSLPACQGGEVPDLANPLTMSCLPPTLDAATATSRFRSTIINNSSLLQNTPIDLQRTANQQDDGLDQRLTNIPAVYDHVRQGMYITGALAILLAALVIRLSTSWRRGLGRVGITALIVGIISSIIAWLAGYGLRQVGENIAASDTNTHVQGSIIQAITFLTQDMRNWWIGYGLALAIGGIIVLVAVRIFKNRQLQEENTAPAVATSTVPGAPTGPVIAEDERSKHP